MDDTGFVTSHGKSKPKVPEANTFYVAKKYFSFTRPVKISRSQLCLLQVMIGNDTVLLN